MRTFKMLAVCVFLVGFLQALPALATPALKLSPTTGTPGAEVHVSGSGFYNDEYVDISINGSLWLRTRASSHGDFPGVSGAAMLIYVPDSLANGSYPVTAVGETSGLEATATFRVTGSASIKLSTNTGPPNSSVNVTGAAFFDDEKVNLYFDSKLEGVADATSEGGISQAFRVPGKAVVGLHTVTATGQISGRSPYASFKVVLPPPPSISLSPIVGPPTTQTTVSGGSFGMNETVDIYFDTTDLVLASTNVFDAFSETLQVPATAVPGEHWITAVGRESGLSAQAPFTVQTNWAQFRYGPRHSGYNPYENVLNSTSVSGLGQAWTGATGGIINSSPAVANGVVYVGSEDKNLYAFNIATGALVWNTATGAAIDSSPAVANGIVYVGSEDGSLYAFNAATGVVEWSAATNGPIYSSPAVANGVVYVGSYLSDQATTLYAFNAASGGTPLWTAQTQGEGQVYSSPAVSNGIVYVGGYDGNLYAFNASSGALLWTASTGNSIESSPVVANGIVFVNSSSTPPDGTLYAFNALTGAFLWTEPTGSVGGGSYSTPAVANGIVYVGSDDSNLYAYNINNRVLLWTGPTGASIDSSPAVANGVVYVASEDGYVYAFDAVYGTLYWTASIAPNSWSSPAVADGVVYVGSQDYNLYAYNLGAGMSADARLATAIRTSGVTKAFKAGPPNPADLKPDYNLKLSE